MSEVAPRVNSVILPQFVNQFVRLVGTVKSVEHGSVVKIETSDKKIVILNQKQGTIAYQPGQIVEVVARVLKDQRLEEACDHVVFPHHFDLQNYDSMVSLQNRFADLFGIPQR
eukprot:TRINITY_DN432_c0_g1_i1.p1 TRINITY_DN432_c0_g1~~TRINITY_DN432_c0_g1_i1.p1  ORF type:complete len:113 (-),score=16.59 TRINITY_DN432_c0_g1_i1:135-473(-)